MTKQFSLAAIVREMLDRHPDHPARAIARAISVKTKGAYSVEQCRQAVRRAIGSVGAKGRKRVKPTHARPPRSPGQTIEMPKSVAQPRTRFTFPASGAIGIISDIHVPYHSDVALAAAVKHLKRRKVRGLLVNGDAADMFSISRWDKDPTQRDFGGELAQVRQFFAWLRREFPKIPIVLKSGNHEERYEHFLWQRAPELCGETELIGLHHWLHLPKHGIEFVSNRRVVMVGKLPVLHGHELPRGMASPVNQARGAFVRTMHTVLVGHGHRTSGHAESNMWNEETFCWSTGCLCDLSPDYASIGNKWNWGAAIVDVSASGEFDVENFRITKAGEVRTS